MAHGLRDAIPNNAVHLCVDMQRMFVEDTPWGLPWAGRVMPRIVRLCEHRPDRLAFTRFIPAAAPGAGRGAWGRYWTRWASMTLAALDPAMVDLALPLQTFAPPGRLIDKPVYSPWLTSDLDAALARAEVDTLVVTGGETDVCVLATVLGAIDLGYRVVVVSDGVCSSADEPHDALLGLYHDRFSQQIETAPTEEVLDAWR